MRPIALLDWMKTGAVWSRRGNGKSAHFPKEVILFALLFYVRHTVSYHDLEKISAERCVHVNHATLNRWIAKYSPLIASTAQVSQ